jgi:hypothetical protein
MYGGSVSITTPFLTPAMDGGDWTASRPGHFIPWGNNPGAEWIWDSVDRLAFCSCNTCLSLLLLGAELSMPNIKYGGHSKAPARALSLSLSHAHALAHAHQPSDRSPYARNLGFLDRSRYFFFQVVPQLYSRGWVDSVPDPLLLRKSDSAGNRTRTSGSVVRNSDH